MGNGILVVKFSLFCMPRSTLLISFCVYSTMAEIERGGDLIAISRKPNNHRGHFIGKKKPTSNVMLFKF